MSIISDDYDADTLQLLDVSHVSFQVTNLQKVRLALGPNRDLVILCSGTLEHKSESAQQRELAIVIPDHQIDIFFQELLSVGSLPLEEKMFLCLKQISEELSSLNTHLGTYIDKLSRRVKSA